MMEYIRPDEILNIYYKIYENNITYIVNITKEDNDITKQIRQYSKI